jgi:hypothetical protein
LFPSVLSTGQVSLVGSQVTEGLFCNADDCGCSVGVSDGDVGVSDGDVGVSDGDVGVSDGDVDSFLLSTISFFMCHLLLVSYLL